MESVHLHRDEFESPLLRRAAVVAGNGGSPVAVLRRLRDVGLVALGSLVVAGVASFVLLRSTPETEHWQLAIAFVFAGAIGVFLVALLGLGVILWSAYVQQRIQALEARLEADELATNVKSFLFSLNDGLVSEVISEVVEKSPPEAKKLAEAASRETCSSIYRHGMEELCGDR
jgi:hypothetical protein